MAKYKIGNKEVTEEEFNFLNRHRINNNIAPTEDIQNTISKEWFSNTTSHNSLRYKDSARDDKVFEEFKNSRVPVFKDNPNLGVKHNQAKLPMSKLMEQFPKALQAVVLCSSYGANKYKEKEIWDNFKKVAGGSKNYKDAGLRHMFDGDIDEESKLPHIFLKLWNALAETELYIEENNINIKKFSENYLLNMK